MAHTEHGFDTSRRPPHDGSLRCILCANTNPEADHEWCPAAECLVCDDCCQSLLRGDPHRMASMAANAERVICPESLMRACSKCTRGHRHFAEDMLEQAGDEDGIC